MMRLTFILAFLATAGMAGTPSFWQQMTPEQRKAAGVDQLTAAQQAALDAAASDFAREGARKNIETAIARAREEAKAEVAAEQKKQKVANAGLAVRDDDESIRTRIAGDFRGWTGNTVFKLENGQVWQQTDKQDRFFPKMVNPDVELTPNKLFGWKLTLLAEGLSIRVKRVQ